LVTALDVLILSIKNDLKPEILHWFYCVNYASFSDF
jgi:hypothetical protein